MSNIIHLHENIKVCQNMINTGIIVEDKKSILINCGQGSFDIINNYFSSEDINQIGKVMFTDHFSDKVRGFHRFTGNDTTFLLPEGAEDYFLKPESYWFDSSRHYHQYNNYQYRFHVGTQLPHSLKLATITGGDEIGLKDLMIKVIATPGITDSGLSFLVDVGQKKYCFTGDLIVNGGRLINIYYLQQGKDELMDYHGFGGRIDELRQSLKKLLTINPDVIIPARGGLIGNPEEDINKLLSRLDKLEDNYYQISSLKFWFNDQLNENKINEMNFKASYPQISLPEWVLELKDTTTRGIKAKDGTLFLIDCGQTEVIQKLKQMQKQQEIQDVDCVWISHYHDDHVDFINNLKDEFSCDIYTIDKMQKILKKPSAFLMPCLSEQSIDIDYLLENNTTFNWKDFQMTAYYLPGQTIYHAGLLVAYEDIKVFFIGDSFTPGGIDDYCAYNRNLLGEDLGYIYCLQLLKNVEPDILINQHQPGGFSFSTDDIFYMQHNLKQRIKLHEDILPYKNINYGLDPDWVRCYPFKQLIKNNKVNFEVIIFNSSSITKEYYIEPVFPYDWKVDAAAKTMRVAGKAEKSLQFNVDILENNNADYGVVGINVKGEDYCFPEIAKSILHFT